MISSTPRPHFTPGKDPVPILQEAGWAPGPVWTGKKSLSHRDWIPDRPARSSVAIPTELPGPHFLNSTRQNSCVCHIVGRDFLFYVKINSYPLMSAIAAQLVLHGEKFSICFHQDFFHRRKKKKTLIANRRISLI